MWALSTAFKKGTLQMTDRDTKASSNESASTAQHHSQTASTKDSGKVRMGDGGMITFSARSTKDNGKVRLGDGGMIRF